MKNTKEMFPGCLYLFEGQSSSSSCFIQNEEDARSFLNFANYYLKDFLKICEYNLTKDGWLLIVKIRSKQKIFKSYNLRRSKSKTCNRSLDHKDIWRIISEQMRQFLRHYVMDANKRSGREGSVVKESYKRSFFECLEEANQHVNNLRNQLLKKAQKLKKYRGRKKFYKIAKKKIKGHIFLCSGWKNTRKKINDFKLRLDTEMKGLFELGEFMSLSIITATIKTHVANN